MQSKAQLRHSFLSYNSARYNSFAENYSTRQARLLHLLPLLLHTNVNLMPGFISKNTPQGIAGYTPDEQNLEDARKLNKQFVYDFDNPPAAEAIDALLIQQCILSGETILWVIVQKHLDSRQLDLLRKKTASIVKWLAKFGIHMSYIVSQATSISYNYYSYKHFKFHIDKCFFLDSFYAESILLGGKIPAWWLYVDEKTQQEDDQVLHYGDLSTPRANDYMSAAIWYLYNIFKQPENSWINLALIDQFVTSRMHQFFSVQLREIVHNADELDEMDIYQDYIVYLKDLIDLKISEIDYGIIASTPNSLSDRVFTDKNCDHHKTIFDDLAKISRHRNSQYMDGENTNFALHNQNIGKLFKLSENLFRRIKTFLNLTSPTAVGFSPELNAITNGLLSRLTGSEQKINISNMSPIFSLEKIHFRHNINSDEDSWSIFPDKDDTSRAIYTSTNLVQLVCWAYINKLIDAATQVSIQCPDYIIRQTDILNIVKTLQHSLSPGDFCNIDIENYMAEPMPRKSLLFIGHMSESFREQTIDHLIIYNTGEVFINSYRGLHVFYNWFETQPQQSVNACLYGSWANDYRTLNRKILSRISDISLH